MLKEVEQFLSRKLVYTGLKKNMRTPSGNVLDSRCKCFSTLFVSHSSLSDILDEIDMVSRCIMPKLGKKQENSHIYALCYKEFRYYSCSSDSTASWPENGRFFPNFRTKGVFGLWIRIRVIDPYSSDGMAVGLHLIASCIDSDIQCTLQT